MGMAALLSKANRYLSKVVPAGMLAWVAPEVILRGGCTL